ASPRPRRAGADAAARPARQLGHFLERRTLNVLRAGDDRRTMKRIMAPVIVAALGCVVAGCGSGHKAAGSVTTLPRSVVEDSSNPDRIVVTGTLTLSHVKVGTEIACKGGDPGWLKVPAVPPASDGQSYSVEESDGGHWSDGGPTTGMALSASSDGS